MGNQQGRKPTKMDAASIIAIIESRIATNESPEKIIEACRPIFNEIASTEILDHPLLGSLYEQYWTTHILRSLEMYKSAGMYRPTMPGSTSWEKLF